MHCLYIIFFCIRYVTCDIDNDSLTVPWTKLQINVKPGNAQQFENIWREAHMYGGYPFAAKSQKASLSWRADDENLTIMTITFGASPVFHTLTSWFHGWHLGLASVH